MFGTSHLYVFVNPEEVKATKDKENKSNEVEITYEMALKEIAKNSGLNVQNKSTSNENGEEVEAEETLG